MKIVFFGTPIFSADILSFLLKENVAIGAVVTQPDRPKGRALQLAPSPVKALVLEQANHIPILQPEKASESAFLDQLTELQADLFVVVAYGQILSQQLLDIPPLGCINVHTSLLPKYRGAAPIQRALIAGEIETGVSVQKMVRQLDAGDVIATTKMPLPQEMTFGELEKELCSLSKKLLLEVIHQYEQAIPPATAQNHAEATYAAKIELEEGELNWSRPASQLHNLIRAFSPKPGAWAWIASGGSRKKLKILRSEVVDPQMVLGTQGEPGALIRDIVICGEDGLRLLEVQPEGKKVMTAADWLRGQKNISF